MGQELQRQQNQDLTISKQALPQIWKNLPVTAATTELEAAKTPKLYELARQVGADLVVLLIKSELIKFIEFSGCEWSGASVEGILEQITSSYGHLTMAQWKLFFAKAKSGVFAQEGQRDGQTMIARITPMIFMQWLTNYAAKCEDANEIEYARAQRAARPLPDITDGFAAYWVRGKYPVCDRKIYTSKALLIELEKKQREQEADAEEKREDSRRRQVEAYAKLQNINLQEVVKQFGRQRTFQVEKSKTNEATT